MLRLTHTSHCTKATVPLLVLLLFCFFCTTVSAATFTVNTTDDTNDATPGNGICQDAAGNCSLRAAIQEANALPGPDIIIVPAGIYLLTKVGAGENAAVTGDLDITSDITIIGAATQTTIIDADSLDRVFHVLASGTATLELLWLKRGHASPGSGGGIFNAGTLSLTDIQITDCGAEGANGTLAGGGFGGGLHNSGTATILRTTINSCVAQGGEGSDGAFCGGGGGSGGGGGFGGAVFNDAAGTMTITSTTLSGNAAIGGRGGRGQWHNSCGLATGVGGNGGGAGGAGGPGFGAGGSQNGQPGNFGGGGGGGGSNWTNPGSGGNGGYGGGGGGPGARLAGNAGGVVGTGGFGGGDGANGCCSAAGGSGGGAGLGGGVFNNGGTITLLHTTIYANGTIGGAGRNGGFTGPGQNGSAIGGGIFNRTGTVNVSGSIIALNTAPSSNPDIHGAITSTSGYNWIQVVGGATLAGTTTNNTYGLDPLLEPLANTGGNTWTHDPQLCSPVIDIGSFAVAPAIDQLENPPIQTPDLGAQEDLPEFQNMLGNDSTLCSGQTFVYDVSAFGTVFLWSTGATTASVSLTSAGIYSVTVVNGTCAKADTVELSAGFDFTASATISTCQQPNGTATVTPTGGAAPHIFLWDAAAGSQTTGTATGLVPGTYAVTITDNSGCGVDTQLTIPSQPPLVTTTDSTDIPCFGGATGTANVSPSGGNSPYQYMWGTSAGGQTTATATGLIAGTHNITITDSDNCTIDTFVVVNQPPQMTLDTASTPAVCFGGLTGTATVTAAGGATPYVFLWSAGAGSQTTSTATGLASGSFTCTVTDNNGCTADTLVIVGQPSALVVGTDSTTVSCNGGTNGSATVIPSGSISPYTYVWNAATGGQTTATASGLAASTYNVVVSDANLCSATVSVTVTQPPLLAISSQVAANTSACGAGDGTITVAALGGSGTIEFSIDGGTTFPNTTGSFTGLSPGSYTVAVRDSLLCTKTGLTITISDPASPGVSLATTAVLCNGGSDGTATISGTSGPSPYTFLWDANAGNQTTATATGLAIGTYAVTLTDAGGCVSDTTITVVQPVVLSASATAVTTSCFLGSDGTATVTPADGTSPYTYLWSASAANQTTATATGLSAGTYSVTVTDNNGCTTTATTTVVQPPLLTTTTSQTPATCNGLGTGSATVAPAGGQTPYAVAWDAGTGSQVGTTASSISGGTYSVTITDGLGCQLDTLVTVLQPDALVASPDSIPVTCNGGADGLAWAFVTGGTTPYAYQWDAAAGSTTTAWAGSLVAGTYDVTVTDASGCTDQTAVIVTEPGPLMVTSLTGTNVTDCQGNDGTVTVTVSGGVSPFQLSTNNGSNFPHSLNATGLTSGLKLIVVIDANGCTVAGGGITLFEPPAPVVNLGPDTNICVGQSLLLDVGQSGTYLWRTGETTQSISVDESGMYLVEFTDVDNCYTKDSIQVTVLPQALAQWNQAYHFCVTDPDEYLDVFEGGGRFDGQGIIEHYTGRFRPAVAGVGRTNITYVIEGQCGDSTSLEIDVDPSPYIWLGPDLVFEQGLEQTLNAGPNFVSYLWNDSLVSQLFTPTESGKYWVTVENAYGCKWTDTIQVRMNCVPELWIPTAFTPDGDGINDEFKVQGQYIGDFQLYLFSRQGEQIWSTRTMDNSWNGKHNGKPAPDGVYVYRIIYEGCPGHLQKTKVTHHMGYVTLLR